MIVAGNGSDEILAMAMRTYLGPGDVLAYPDPTYSLYPVLAEMGEVKVVTVPWAAGWDLPIDALLATGARAIFFANPNAPTGTLVRTSRVRELAHALFRPALGRRGLRGFRRREQPEPGARVLQRDGLPHLEQGLRSGGPALRLRHRGARAWCRR